MSQGAYNGNSGEGVIMDGAFIGFAMLAIAFAGEPSLVEALIQFLMN